MMDMDKLTRKVQEALQGAQSLALRLGHAEIDAVKAMRTAYEMMQTEMNKLFAEPVVAKWQGGKSKGGASLTEFGRSLLEKYAVLVEKSNEVNREILDEIAHSVNSGS